MEAWQCRLLEEQVGFLEEMKGIKWYNGKERKVHSWPTLDRWQEEGSMRKSQGAKDGHG